MRICSLLHVNLGTVHPCSPHTFILVTISPVLKIFYHLILRGKICMYSYSFWPTSTASIRVCGLEGLPLGVPSYNPNLQLLIIKARNTDRGLKTVRIVLKYVYFVHCISYFGRPTIALCLFTVSLSFCKFALSSPPPGSFYLSVSPCGYFPVLISLVVSAEFKWANLVWAPNPQYER